METKWPRKAIIAPSHDIRQKFEFEFRCMEEVKTAQRERYEILKWLD